MTTASPPGGGFRTRGHGVALAVVERAVRRERPPHALLLVGPPRVGKTTLALDLAAGLLCLAADASDRPCRDCAACRKLDHGNHPDLHVLAPEGAGRQIRLGQVHALVAELALLPLEGRFRVAIVEAAHRLNPDAQNALLKTLEEPPARVAIVLCADESSALLSTVISRCARVRLGPVGADAVTELLRATGLADAARAAAVARLSGGRPGLALALAGEPEALVTRARLARTLLDLLSADRRRRLAAPAELLADAAALAAATGSDGSSRDESERPARATGAARISPAERRAAVSELLGVWRDLARDLLVATSGGLAEIRDHELMDDLGRAVIGLEPAAIAAFLSRLDELSRAVDAYANPELMLDVLLLEWPRRARAA